MKAKTMLKTSVDIGIVLLEATANSADAFPPLKSAAGGALHIAKLVKGFRSHQREWAVFGEHVQNIVACVIELIPDAQKAPDEIRKAIEGLSQALELIRSNIQGRMKKSGFRRALAYLSDPDSIREMRTKLDDALRPFQIQTQGRIAINIAALGASIRDLNIQDHINRINEKLDDIISDLCHEEHSKIRQAPSRRWSIMGSSQDLP
ncbi:hypothetical protein M422DRAFT_781490 [Sphaerobolus stellatus SS14]|uniref:Uncharacterized protein n=1 Tax=Sphaerobolus stellatus (strain SS14) TaxID=990650 RepID=A0A0C9U5C1_SPHS4|nr:hypothetical protein M422DRAFT_781490 [Sphaerobolus stellatus SS14]